VVKADAYGLGLIPVAQALKAAGCATFYVAHLDEGLALRAAIPAPTRIAVMHGPNPGTEKDFAAANLIPVLSTPEQIDRWRRYASAADVLSESIVQVDTGMKRLGLTETEFAARVSDPDGFVGLHPLALMSHLACADQPAHPMNREQLTRFVAQLATFRGRFPDAKATLANSSGVFLGADFLFDFARPGVALYGVNPTPTTLNPMLPVVRLAAKILQVHRVDRAGRVGYGASIPVPDGAKLATVSMGYADGYLRSLSTAGGATLDGHKVSVIGRVSMDLTTFDVSNVPESALIPGAMIDVIGTGHTVDDVAREANTIGYEILTSLGSRYFRRYLPAGKSA